MIAPSELIAAFRDARAAALLVRVEDGCVCGLNPAAELLLGWSASEALGQTPSALALWPDVATRARLWRDIGSRGSARGVSTRLRRRDGSLIALCLDCEPVVCSAGPCLLCWLWPEQPSSDAAPPQERALIEPLWFRCDVEGRLRALSPALGRRLGLAEASSQTVWPHRDLPGLKARIAEALSEGDARCDRCALQGADGRLLWFEERLQREQGGAGLLGLLREVTRQVELAEALQQQRALFQVLVDNCRDGVFLIQHGRVRFANAALADLLRMPLEQLLGREYMELVHPEDLAVQGERRRARESGSTASQRYRVRVLRGDGSCATVEVNADAVWFDGALASSGIMRDISEDSARHLAIEAAEKRYRELFETAPVGLFRTRPSGEILDVNQPMLQLLGYESIDQVRAEIAHVAEVYADPGEREALVETLRQNGRIDGRQISLRARDGSLRWVNLSMRVVAATAGGEAELAGSVQDYSARREAELRLQRSESMYRALVEHAQVGVFVSDGERLTYANRTLCALLGRDEAELLAQPLGKLRLPDQREAADEAWQRLLSGASGGEEFESCFIRPDGRRVWTSESVGPVDIDGRLQLTGSLRDVSRQREVERRLRYYATHDPLTGLPNRLDFQQRLDELIRDAHERGDHHYALLFLDLDGFKLINDSLGHAAGDRLLVGLAGKVTDLLGGEALVARYGGDEFTILPYGRCDRVRAVQIARRVVDLFQTPIVMGEDQAFSSASVGVVLGGPDYVEASQVLRDADTAMYRAKAAGKAGFAVFDEAMHAEARQRFELEVALRSGLERQEFEVFFQPIVELAGRRVVGCEALVRWRHPQRGLLLPGEFLPVAEESGLIVRMDAAALEQACRQLRRWQASGLVDPGFQLNVNVNDRQVTSSSFPDELRDTLRRIRLEPESLRLEITESVFRGGRQGAGSLLRALKRVGVQLVVDDFGTGYSSLDSFAAAPFDALKIDRSFVADLDSNPRHRAIIRTIIGFGADLGLTLTAEGVEQPEQERFLLDAGCPCGQGFRYGKAMPAGEFEALLQRQRQA